jgi:hypothetical protein
VQANISQTDRGEPGKQVEHDSAMWRRLRLSNFQMSVLQLKHTDTDTQDKVATGIHVELDALVGTAADRIPNDVLLRKL